MRKTTIPIATILVLPRNKNYCTYCINGNFKDRHAMNYDEIRDFINGLLKPPATVIVLEYLSKHLPFFVDVEKNFVKELVYEPEEKILNEEFNYKVIIKNIYKNKRKSREKTFIDQTDRAYNSILRKLST